DGVARRRALHRRDRTRALPHLVPPRGSGRAARADLRRARAAYAAGRGAPRARRILRGPPSRVRPAPRPPRGAVPRGGAARARPRAVRPHGDVRLAGREGRPSQGSTGRRHGDEPQPDPDHPPVPPHRRREWIADGIRRRPAREARPARARRRDASLVTFAEVEAWVRTNLPPPPAYVLEVGAGDGELARRLRAAGYDVA